MTDNTDSELTATGRTTAPMFEILEATGEDVVAVRMGHGTSTGYRTFYGLLVEKTDEYGTVHVYEEATWWTLSTAVAVRYLRVPAQ